MRTLTYPYPYPCPYPYPSKVKDFDFVSPRAVMEEYMGNMYALRSGGDD